jgi:hypothetical protein
MVVDCLTNGQGVGPGRCRNRERGKKQENADPYHEI